MARAAFLMDRVMRRVGLHGKSFIPLLSSMACTVPGIMATRTIENRRDRLATILVAPLISCSARLPVYFILIALIFPRESVWTKAGVLAGIYLAGILLALGIATILKKTVLRGPTPMFIMELPPYRLPDPLAGRPRRLGSRPLLPGPGRHLHPGRQHPALGDLLLAPPRRAGQVPETHEMLSQAMCAPLGRAVRARRCTIRRPTKCSALSAHALQGSVLSPSADCRRPPTGILPGRPPRQTDRTRDPSARLRLADRRGHHRQLHRPRDLRQHDGHRLQRGGRRERRRRPATRMQAAVRPDGTPVFSRATCLSLLVFYTLALQCISTLAVAWRETGSWRWPAFLWLYMDALAYGGAFVTYRVAAAFGLAT